jgi:hypothetical protein
MRRAKATELTAALAPHVERLREQRAHGYKHDHRKDRERAVELLLAKKLGTSEKDWSGPVLKILSVAQLERLARNTKFEIAEQKRQQKRSTDLRAEALRMHQHLSTKMSSTMAIEFVAAYFGIDPRSVWRYLRESRQLTIDRKT